MNYISYIIPPLIGALIGYITNWIAVKMLFRPLKPKYIGKFKLPFTPGIIPKNKERLAKSISVAINDNLLTSSDLTNKLLSNDTKKSIENKIIELSKSEKTVQDSLTSALGNETYLKFSDTIVTKLTEVIYNSVVDANLGKIVSEQVTIAAQEKLQGSLFGLFGAGSIISSVSEMAETKTNSYIEENGIFMIHEMIDKKNEELSNSKICDICNNINANIPQIITNLYEKVVSQNIETLLNSVNISQIIENKIKEMDTLEMEKLILSIMKKELNALVSLGALIGFVLGLVNIFF